VSDVMYKRAVARGEGDRHNERTAERVVVKTCSENASTISLTKIVSFRQRCDRLYRDPVET
jgi:hypothetical protein